MPSTDRDEALAAVYSSVEPELKARGVSLERYVEMLADWEVFPVRADGAIVGAALRHQDEIHVGVLRTPPGAQMWMVHDVLADTIRRFGQAVTYVPYSHIARIKFCRRLGFRVQACRETSAGVVFQMACKEASYAASDYRSRRRIRGNSVGSQHGDGDGGRASG